MAAQRDAGAAAGVCRGARSGRGGLYAATSSANPLTNTTVTCTGTTLNQNQNGAVFAGYGVPEDKGITINVGSITNSTASVTGTDIGIQTGNASSGIGPDTVNNFGTVIGNVLLGSGRNAFNNMAGAVFNAGSTVDLGAGNTLTNAGTLSPGGAGVIQATALTGNLVQTATGRLLTDINLAGGTSDRVNISGTASLAGAVQLVSPVLGAFQQTILSAARDLSRTARGGAL